MAKLASILGVTDVAVRDAMQADLIDLCAHFRAVIAIVPTDLPDAPFNMTLTKRADWLEAHVIHPCEKLLAAAAANMQPMFTRWPYPLAIPQTDDRAGLTRELDALLTQASDIRDLLRAQQADKAGHSQELRAEIFAGAARIVRQHCPDTKPSRGVYDREFRRWIGSYADAMRLILSNIIGVTENLDRLIRAEINHPS